MCGINGIYAYSANSPCVDVEELVRVRDSMALRGPDCGEMWLSKDHRVGLGHRRLSIIDLSADGNQPMVSGEGRYVITTNGEIYNYQALRRELEAKGHRFRTQSDTEVILAMYSEYGVDMFSRLRGMFAMGLWDSLKRELILGRGPMGIKPLYLADNGRTLRFASQVRALLEGDEIDRTAEPAGHVGFFIWGHVPEPFTLYRGIRELPAGSYLIANEHGVVEQRAYCHIRGWLAAPGGVFSRAELREALADTVAHHFVSDVPVSLFLSAGRDSGTLLALAAENRSDPVRTATLAFKEYAGTPDDESVLASEVASQYGADHRSHLVAADEFRGDVDEFFEAMDQPSVDGANTYFVCKVASALGVRVALSGLGADEIFGGYPSFSQVPRLVRSLSWTTKTPWLGRASRRAVSRLMPRKMSPKYAGLLEYGGTIEDAFLLRRSLYMPWEVFESFDAEFAAQGLADLAIRERLASITEGLPTAHAKIVALELSFYMQDRLLKDSDWASMAHSLELRVPFVDIELIRRIGPWIASSTPPTKDDMARCPTHQLPSEVLTRGKTGFNIPVTRWVLEMEGQPSKEPSLRRWARYVYGRKTGNEHLRKACVRA